eukprot:362340-Chlamydomonas_euryale.AAC.4
MDAPCMVATTKRLRHAMQRDERLGGTGQGEQLTYQESESDLQGADPRRAWSLLNAARQSGSSSGLGAVTKSIYMSRHAHT